MSYVSIFITNCFIEFSFSNLAEINSFFLSNDRKQPSVVNYAMSKNLFPIKLNNFQISIHQHAEQEKNSQANRQLHQPFLLFLLSTVFVKVDFLIHSLFNFVDVDYPKRLIFLVFESKVLFNLKEVKSTFMTLQHTSRLIFN